MSLWLAHFHFLGQPHSNSSSTHNTPLSHPFLMYRVVALSQWLEKGQYRTTQHNSTSVVPDDCRPPFQHHPPTNLKQQLTTFTSLSTYQRPFLRYSPLLTRHPSTLAPLIFQEQTNPLYLEERSSYNLNLLLGSCETNQKETQDQAPHNCV